MPVIIEELSTHLDVTDEAKLRELVQEEIKRAMAGTGTGYRGADASIDPADPNAADAKAGG